MMLQLSRASRPIRAALLIAAALTLGSSLGLHAEPGAAPGLGFSAGGSVLESARRAAPAHGCPACLAHASVSLARASAVLFAPAALDHLFANADTQSFETAEFRSFQGRAPPAGS